MNIHDERKIMNIQDHSTQTVYIFISTALIKKIKFDQGMQETIENSYAQIFKYQPNQKL